MSWSSDMMVTPRERPEQPSPPGPEQFKQQGSRSLLIPGSPRIV